ncbi:MAG: primary ciliary dyskinesia 1-like [Trebouxia sp. A1-2]|nr:MAG: primary ciliary dyskinesia 1-like [Trebouxia sp. A1-2]
MNQTKFPRRISFGKCAVGETYTKRVNLTCNVPIEFEYEITMLEASAAFTVQPQHGVVPANGVVEVQVTFNPSRLVTEVVELEIRVAEFQSETVRCTVSGSGFPGLARQHQLAGLTASLGSTLPEEAPIWGKAKTGRLPKGTITTGKGGAGGGDAYTRLQTQKQQQGGPRDSRITGPIKAKLPALRPPTPPSKIEGLVVPAHPNQQAHMAMLLNQQPGKLMLSDIQVADSADVQVAIEEKKKLLAEKEATLRRTLGRSKDTSLDPLDDSSLPRETKARLCAITMQADLFEYLCLEAQQHRRDVELNALEPQVGSDPLTPPQLAQIQEARKQHQQQAAANQRQAAVHRQGPMTAVEMQAAAASTVRPRQQAGQTTADASSSEGPAGTRFVEEAAGASATAQPRWDCNDGDTWHKRQQALHRFAQAGRKVIHRARAARRLALISTLVQNLKDPQSSQTLDHRNAIAGTAASPDVNQQAAKQQQQQHQAQATFKFDAAQVLPTLPVHQDVPFMQYTPVEMPQYSVDFSSYEPMEPQVPKYYELMGYTEEPLPPFTPYANPMLDQPFMEGAIEEEAGPHPTGLVPDLSEWLAMPDFCLQRSQHDLPIGTMPQLKLQHSLRCK